MQNYTCPCCGYTGLDEKPFANIPHLTEAQKAEPPYEDLWGRASYEVCPCCEFEFGFDDNPGNELSGNSFAQALAEFIERGCPWNDPALKPANWNLKKQLQDAGLPIPETLK